MYLSNINRILNLQVEPKNKFNSKPNKKYFNGLKLEINHTKELYVQLIENKYDFIMKQIIELENDCKTKAKKSENYLNKNLG